MKRKYVNDITERNAERYAGFFLPYIRPGMRLLDCGCREGAITMGLAEAVRPGEVTGIDIDDGFFEEARSYAGANGIENVGFERGDIYSLNSAGGTFDAAFLHSVLEALDRPIDALKSVRRALDVDGLIGVASIDYGGVIIGGESQELLDSFYAIRERLALIRQSGEPRTGRQLRGMLHRAGFTDVVASSNYITYGDSSAIRAFATDRVAEIDDEFVETVTGNGLADEQTLRRMKTAWGEWGDLDSSYFAFAWCNAIGRNPG